MTMLSTWLVELYLNHLGKLREDEEHSDEFLKNRKHLRDLLAQVNITNI